MRYMNANWNAYLSPYCVRIWLMNSRASEVSVSGASMLSMYFSTLLADENIVSARVWRFPKMSVCGKPPANLRALTGLIDGVRAYKLEVGLRSFQDGTLGATCNR